MAWAQSQIKLSTYEVETLQKRLADLGAQRQAVEMRLAMLVAEGEAEAAAAARDPENGWRIMAYLDALKIRKDQVRSEIIALELEEQGARDALAQAFETQKKYEEVAEQMRLAGLREAGRRETAALDELGLRAKAG
jgi:flagellar FliJ protein